MAAASKSLLIIGHVWPEPQLSAAGSRMIQLIRSFTDAGYAVYFSSTADPPGDMAALNALKVERIFLPLNKQQASDAIRDLKPDVVLFDRFMTEEQFGWRVHQEVPDALRILNMEDLHSLRQARQRALEQGVQCDPDFWLKQEITLRELASILRSDLSLITSRYERESLTATGIVPEDIMFYLPFMYDTIKNFKTDSYNNFINRSDFVFFGYGKHNPNADAVRFLVTSIWPRIRLQIPGVSLLIYGRDYPADIRALHDPGEGIFIKGWVENLDPVIAQARVNLAPLRYGAGLKGKIVHALRLGTPNVMTHIAAEGLFETSEFDPFIADDPEAFVQIAVRLYMDKIFWEDAVTLGRGHMAKELDREHYHSRLHSRLDQLGIEIETHRNKHLISRMLNHQSMQSSRYMAKWIEAKNAT